MVTTPANDSAVTTEHRPQGSCGVVAAGAASTDRVRSVEVAGVLAAVDLGASSGRVMLGRGVRGKTRRVVRDRHY
jgi:hypothetical protein